MQKSILILLLFTQCSSMNYTNIKIENGIYYGQNKGFFPQTSVFVTVNDYTALAEGFYPLKGVLFATFTDTLYYSEEAKTFSNEKSILYLQNNKLYFEREDVLLYFKVEKTKLKFELNNENKYIYFKEKSIPYQ